MASDHVIFIVLAVLLFMGLGVAILVAIDSKARIPGEFRTDPFSISGIRRDHPGIAFLTALVLLVIILALIFELAVTLGERFGLFAEKEKPQIIQDIKEQRFTERQRHFHNEPKDDRYTRGKKQVCFYCHGEFPHSKERMVRTLLNMHTQFIGCMTCHIDPRKVAESTYKFRWLNYSGIEVKGPPFGTDVDPKTGYLVKTDDYYSKIVVYAVRNGEEELLEITEDRPEVQEFKAVREKLSERDREAIKQRFHKRVSEKGRFCSRCHVQEKKSYIPYRRLGFSEQRIADVTNLNIVGIVEKYRKFYMPNLFQKESSLPDVESLVGSGQADLASKASFEDWWKRTTEPEKKKR